MLNLLLVLSDKLGLKRGLLKSYYFRKFIFITIFKPSLKRLYLTHKNTGTEVFGQTAVGKHLSNYGLQIGF